MIRLINWQDSEKRTTNTQKPERETVTGAYQQHQEQTGEHRYRCKRNLEVRVL